MADKYAQLWAIFSFYFYVRAKILYDDDDTFHHSHVTSSLL